MAVRRARRRYTDVVQFMKEYNETLKQGGIFLPPESYRGKPEDVAPEIKLDLELPFVGRVGPIQAQVVHRAPDGGLGLRVNSYPTSVKKAFQQVFEAVDRMREYFVSSGDLIPREKVEEMIAEKVAALEAEVATRAPVPSAEQTAEDRRVSVIPNIEEMARAQSGSMANRSFRDMLLQLAVNKSRGLVVVQHGNGAIHYGFWDRGGPVGWRAEPLDESEVLGVLLYRSKQITKEQLEEALAYMSERQCRQGEAFIEMGLMTFPQLVMVLGKQVEYILQQVMKERDGEWSFYEMDRLPEQFLPPPLKVPAMLYRALARHASKLRPGQLMQSLHDQSSMYVNLATIATDMLDEFAFNESEKKLLEIIQGSPWRMSELFKVTPLNRTRIAQIIWAMAETGIVDFSSTEDRAQAIIRLRKRIMEKRRFVRSANFFQVLEVHWICLGREVTDSFARLQRDFDITGFDTALPEEMREDAEMISGYLKKAHGVLGNDGSRRAYRQKVIQPGTILQTAERLGQKGEVALMRKVYDEACVCFAKAVELDPENINYKKGLRKATAAAAAAAAEEATS
ncbi:MAG: hypothetical protein AAFV53_14875 [Myxococcota bacterium]